MRLTNKYGFPQPLVDAVRNDGYTKGDADYSVTGLLTPPRITELLRQHGDELEEDVADRIYSLVGQVVHGILERAERTAIAEKRYYMQVDGIKISGQLDRLIYDQGKIQDYKFVSTWKIVDGVPEEYEQQVNSYAELLRQNDMPVRQMEIVAILRDWTKTKAKTVEKYPPHQAVILPVPLWEPERALAFIRERIRLHEQAKRELPLCSDEDRWATQDCYAVLKGKRCVRIYKTAQEAQEHVKAFGDGYTVQLRRGENKRCQAYCLVADKCDQWRAIQCTRDSNPS